MLPKPPPMCYNGQNMTVEVPAVKLLITAFEPFGGEAVNPAQLAVEALPDRIGAAQLVKLAVPVEFGRSAAVVCAAIDAHRPDAVLCVGQAGGRAAITPERVAINCDDARIPDNAGAQPVDAPVAADGPAAYFATLPVKAMVAAIRQAGLPAALSNTAGTYVCNHLMYAVLHHLAQRSPQVRAGFLHLPYMTEQTVGKPAGTPGLSLEALVQGLTAAVTAIARNDADLHAAEGAEC